MAHLSRSGVVREMKRYCRAVRWVPGKPSERVDLDAVVLPVGFGFGALLGYADKALVVDHLSIMACGDRRRFKRLLRKGVVGKLRPIPA